MQNNEEDNGNSAALKKPKLVWTHELHNRFVQAVKLIGIDGKFLDLNHIKWNLILFSIIDIMAAGLYFIFISY